MKIGEALAEKKRLQNRLAKCNELLKKSYYYKKKPDFDYYKLTKEVEKLTEKIKDIKMQIMHTNMSTNVNYKGDEISLAELIIELGDIRSRIAVLNELYNPKDWMGRFRYDDEDNVQPQVPPEEVEKEILKLNNEKTELDALLQHTNWTVELMT